eukprot:Pgem_evm1s15701
MLQFGQTDIDVKKIFAQFQIDVLRKNVKDKEGKNKVEKSYKTTGHFKGDAVINNIAEGVMTLDFPAVDGCEKFEIGKNSL